MIKLELMPSKQSLKATLLFKRRTLSSFFNHARIISLLIRYKKESRKCKNFLLIAKKSLTGSVTSGLLIARPRKFKKMNGKNLKSTETIFISKKYLRSVRKKNSSREKNCCARNKNKKRIRI